MDYTVSVGNVLSIGATIVSIIWLVAKIDAQVTTLADSLKETKTGFADSIKETKLICTEQGKRLSIIETSGYQTLLDRTEALSDRQKEMLTSQKKQEDLLTDLKIATTKISVMVDNLHCVRQTPRQVDSCSSFHSI